jgi:hypothetical protein
MKRSYDPACEDLARHFIQDGADIYTEDNVKALAQHIQEAIESWIAYQEGGEGHLC